MDSRLRENDGNERPFNKFDKRLKLVYVFK